MSVKQISLVRDFTAAPGARRIDQGPFSGEDFRERVLKPALKLGNVVLDLNGALGLPPSFLDEAIAMLIQTDKTVAEKLRISLRDNSTALMVLRECIVQRSDPKTAAMVFLDNDTIL